MRAHVWGSVLAPIVVAGVAAATGVWAQEARPVIEPEAETVLRQLGERNRQLKTAVFRVADTIDEVQEDGQSLQFSHVRELTVFRPNKLRVVTTGDVTSRTFWKDGKTMTLLDRGKNVYVQVPDPGTIEQAIDLLQEKYNLSMPAADVLSEDMYRTMTAGCESVRYVGTGYVGEEKCHHLAAVRGDIDWQLWVSLGDAPSLRKLLIIYKRLRGEPRYTLQLLAQGDANQISDATFVPEIPDGTERIQIRPAAQDTARPSGEERQPAGQARGDAK